MRSMWAVAAAVTVLLSLPWRWRLRHWENTAKSSFTSYWASGCSLRQPYLTSGCPAGSTPSAPYPRPCLPWPFSFRPQQPCSPERRVVRLGLRSPRELAGTGTRARHRLLVRGFAAARDSREDSIRWGPSFHRDGLPRHQPGWAIFAINVPSLGVITLLLPFVWLLIEGAKRGAGQPGEQQQPLPERRSPPDVQGPGPKAGARRDAGAARDLVAARSRYSEIPRGRP